MRCCAAVAALLLLLSNVQAKKGSDDDAKGANVALRLIGAASLPAVEQVTFDPIESVAYLIGGTKLYVVDVSASALGLQATTTGKHKKKKTVVTATVSNPSFGNTLPVLATIDFGVALNDVFFCKPKKRAGILAIALNAPNKVDNGQVKVYSRYARAGGAGSLEELAALTVGALPDQLEFSGNCETLLVSNEGEPEDPYNVATDPVGSVSIIRLDCSRSGAVTGTVKTAGFEAFNEQKAQLQAAGVKIDGPGATVAQDVEPEYTTFLAGEELAIVSLQENNAFAILDVRRGRITDIIPLGTQNHGLDANAPDPSDQDGGIRINPYAGVFGLFQPDELKAFRADGVDYVVSANEGDARDYGGAFKEEARGKALAGQPNFDTAAFTPTQLAQLGNNSLLGRLNFLGLPVSGVNDLNGDGKIDRLTSFGSRSWSIWRINKAKNKPTTVTRVFDSGDQFERLSAAALPEIFNSDGTNTTFDQRSDNKGPEPEGVALGVVGKRRYAFIGTERLGVVFAYDLSDPTRPALTSDALPPQANAADPETRFRGPEGLAFGNLRFSHDVEVPLLFTAYETSGGLGVFQLVPQQTP